MRPSRSPRGGLAGIMLLLMPLAALATRAQPSDSLRVAVERAIAEEGLLGATWALVTPDGVTLGAAGLADRARQVPMQPHHRMQVGSVTKTLIATGVLRLVTEGRVLLDAPVAEYLTDVPIENPWAAEFPLRVRHLLDHTAGLDDARMWQVFTLRGDPRMPLVEGLPGRRVQVRHRPGARFSYSNTGYLVAAMVIEKVSGARYEAWLGEHLLAPLGMTRSTFEFVSQVGPKADTTMAMGHFDGVMPQASYAIPVRASSQFATTAADMARLARFLMSDGVVAGAVLVDSALLRQMARPVDTEAVRAGLPGGYALGLVTRERWGITGKCHLGNLGTFRAVLCLYPEHQRAFFAAFNTDPEGGAFDRVDSLLASALAVPPTAVAPTGVSTVDPSAWDGWYAVRPVRFQQFAYLDEVANLTRIRWDGAALTLRPMQGTPRTLRPVGGALFRLDGRRAATHVLYLDSDGTAVVSDGQRTFERVSWMRRMLLWGSALLGIVSLLYLLVFGGVRNVRAWRRGEWRQEPLRWSVVALAALVLAPLLFLTQPFLAVGDPTSATIALAVATALLPVALVASLVQASRGTGASRVSRWNAVPLLGALQWIVVLATWRLVPLILWS